jgi:CHASE2 domain-containing sensor protein
MRVGVRFLALSILSLVIVILVGSSSLTVWFDRVAYDVLNQYYASVNYAASDVVLIDIDQASIDRFSGWPFDRSVHARAIDALNSADVSSITYNVAFVGARGTLGAGDEQLMDAIKRSGRVVLPLIAENNQELKPLDKPELPGAILGHADLSLDEDTHLRRHYLYAGLGFPRWPSLSLASLYIYAPVKADDFSGLRTPYLHVGFSKLWSRDYELLLPFGLASFSDRVLRYPLWALLEGKIPVERIRNKAVFVGLNAPTVEDRLQVSSTDAFFSTEVHAFLFSTLNRGYTLSPSLSVWAVTLGVLATLCWSMVLARLPLGLRLLGLSMFLLLLSVPVWLLSFGYWLSIMPMLAGISSMSVILMFGRVLDFCVGIKKPQIN